MRRFVTPALVIMAAACGGGKDGATVPDPPVVLITSPELEVHGSGPVVIQVVVEGCTPETVQLLLDGEPLATLVGSLQYTWDTTWAAEGPRQIVASADCGGAVGTSAPVTIFVDRTPPEVVDRKPAPSSTTAWVRDPIAVTFSEPVDVASASSALVLRDGLGNVVAATVVASDDGARFTLVPPVTPSVGDAFTVEIGTGVRDLAGYPLVPPDGTWRFSYSEFYQPTGGPLSAVGTQYPMIPDVAVDGSGDPVAVWRLYGSNTAAFVVTGSTVQATTSSTSWGSQCSVAVLGNDVYVVDSVQNAIRVQLLRDGAFSPVGPSVTDGSLQSSATGVSFAPDGTPVVAWEEKQASGIWLLRAAFLDGDAWNGRGTSSLNVNPAMNVVTPSIARDSQGRPAIAFNESGLVYVKRWEGTSWNVVGPGPFGPFVAGSGWPALAFDGVEPYVVVNGAWNVIGVYHLVNGVWTALPGNPMRNSSVQANRPVIAVAGPGRILLAWTEGYISQNPTSAGPLYVSEWNGSAWVPRGRALNRGTDYPAYAPALAIDADGEPVVVWVEPVAPLTSGVEWNLRLARANR